jgi:hypothetical protein
MAAGLLHGPAAVGQSRPKEWMTMVYLLYLKFSNAHTVSVYLTKRGAFRRVAQLADVKDMKWRLKDFSANGGWCGGNTDEPLDDGMIHFGGDYLE